MEGSSGGCSSDGDAHSWGGTLAALRVPREATGGRESGGEAPDVEGLMNRGIAPGDALSSTGDTEASTGD